MRTRSHREPAHLARCLRFVAGGARWDPIVDVAAYVGRVTSIQIVRVVLPRAIAAVLVADRGRRPLLAINAGQTPAQGNFSIAHELGHWVLHPDQSPAALPRSLRRRMEWEADRFAVEFLLPEPLIQRVLARRGGGISASAQQLCVSPVLLRRRLRELARRHPRIHAGAA
jgi:Zn-dependent peptidase ImmA (M78 family)